MPSLNKKIWLKQWITFQLYKSEQTERNSTQEGQNYD